MDIKPYLFFNGSAREAVTMYADIFDIDVPEMLTMDGMPSDMDIPEERRNWVMHCDMNIGASGLYISDDFQGNNPAMEGSSVMVSFPTEAEAKRIFDRLAEGGEIRMIWEPSFWSAGFGTLTDKFGIRWMVGTTETL